MREQKYDDIRCVRVQRDMMSEVRENTEEMYRSIELMVQLTGTYFRVLKWETRMSARLWNRIKSLYIQGGSCCRFPSLNTRLRSTPTPSKTPRRIPQATADPNAALGPPLKRNINRRYGISKSARRWNVLRAAKHPPVMKPEMIAFHASSFCR